MVLYELNRGGSQTLGSGHYLRQGGAKILVQANGGGGQILVQRDSKALLKHLEIPLKIFPYIMSYFCTSPMTFQ